ncbi:MAG TPA: RHS repeat-associated core domain-containing protein, partial [Dissulfurispiraceae bacterium]|nr:RHS repeat-associated core domain-containing protein [Dissulfurispiraceae bacterium]
VTGTALWNVADTWTYNTFAEPVTYTASFGGSPFYSVQYDTYDKLGRIVRRTETLGGATGVYDYTYDLAGRLASVRKNGTTVSTYTFDTNGNRLTFFSGTSTVNGTYDDQDRLLSYGAATYQYTANGELQSKTVGGQTTMYQHDALGNLLNVTIPGTPVTQVEYVVDGRNRRIGKKVNGTLVKGFLYGDQLSPVAELDGSNNLVSYFVYGSRANAPDYIVKEGDTYRVVADHLGSPRLIVDAATGAVVQRMDYDEFGRVLNDTNPGFQPFGFAGGIYDPSTGLTHFGARDYDAEVGRWISKDPLRLHGGSTNFYSYAENEPVNFRDNSGMGPATTGEMEQLLYRLRRTPWGRLFVSLIWGADASAEYDDGPGPPKIQNAGAAIDIGNGKPALLINGQIWQPAQWPPPAGSPTYGRVPEVTVPAAIDCGNGKPAVFINGQIWQPKDNPRQRSPELRARQELREMSEEMRSSNAK